MKKYMDIVRLQNKYAGGFVPGEHITITEKVDGSNASIRYNPETDKLDCFSRRLTLDATNTLNGFWNYVQTLDKNIIQCATVDGKYIIFGEWLIKNALTYPDDKYKNFYMFDMYDTEKEGYVKWDIVKKCAEFCGFTTVPLFYDGSFTSWDNVYSFLGRTDLGATPTGEGIVVKSQDRLDNNNSRTPQYVKIVTEQFSEVHKSKPHKEIDPEKVAQAQIDLETVATVVTRRRVEKQLQRFIEDNIIPSDYDENNFGELAKILPKAILDDCMKEEPETVVKVVKFGKYCAKLSMQYLREIVNERNF